MNRRAHLLFATLVAAAVLMAMPGQAAGHVPVAAEGGEGLATATRLDDPHKSWALYSHLHEGEGFLYFTFELEEGDRLYAGVFTPDDGDFAPGLVIMGPGITSEGEAPRGLEIPLGAEVAVVEGDKEDPEYEPFTPAGNYRTAEYDEEVGEDGTYFVAVYSDDGGGGEFGLAIGYEESFTPLEWVRVPVDILYIHAWEGQEPALVLAPLAFTLAAGLGIIAGRRKRGDGGPEDLPGWFSAVGGLTFIGTGLVLLVQMFRALGVTGADPGAGVTVVFALIPMLLGYSLVRTASKPQGRDDGYGWRVKTALLGALGLVVWAGLVVGPLIVLVGSVLPVRKARGEVK